MAAVSNILLVFACSLLPFYCLAFPLCTDSRTPSKLDAPLKFCQYNGSACCDSAEDLDLQNQFGAMNISELQCAALMRSILCAKCDIYSAQLFNIDTHLRSIPILCNSTVDFCTKVWELCAHVPIYSSPFSSPEQFGGKIHSIPFPFKLIDKWKSKNDFCGAFGGSPDDRTPCFDGKSVLLSFKKDSSPIKGVCIEKIANGSYVTMEAHPDGSDRIFLARQDGKILLAVVPVQGSTGILDINEFKPFLDISDRVLFQTTFGLLGMAFHPNYANNGRFFVSYNCDKLQHSGCSGRCSCNLEANCDPARLPAESDTAPCQYHNVIAEYSVSGVASDPSHAEIANPSEVRRIFTMGLPSHKGHAGQIIIGPADGFMYAMVSYEMQDYDKYGFTQNKKSLLGKILRLDIDKIPSAAKTDKVNLWGNYLIPADNPYNEDKELLPEIWAMGLKNPWRCSFDAERPSYFMCGESGQDLYEEVDIITKGGNYGWPIYEGPFLSHAGEPRQGNVTSDAFNFIFPVMTYTRKDDAGGSASSVTGGYFYRSTSDPCLYGRYLYGDVYANAIWVANEVPENSGNFTSNKKMRLTCANDSPLKCNIMPGSTAAAIGYTLSFGEDNRKDIYILTSSGVYRIVHPSRCNMSCTENTQSGFQSQRPQPASSSSYSIMHVVKRRLSDYLLLCFVAHVELYIAISHFL